MPPSVFAPDAGYLRDVLAFASHGNRCFPVRSKKPLIDNWDQKASADLGMIEGWWRQFRHPGFGWALPPGTLVLDVDDEAAFQAAQLEVPPTANQDTPRGGRHLIYRIPPETVIAQRTNVVPGVDERIGGKGYVVLYDPRRLMATRAEAPAWALEAPRTNGQAGPALGPRVVPDRLTTRDEILLALGKMAATGVGLSEAQYRDVLEAWRETGRLVALDAARPWTDDDLAHLAGEAATWDQKAATDIAWGRQLTASLHEQLARSPAVAPVSDIAALTGARTLASVARLPAAPLLLDRWASDGASILYGAGGVGKGRLAAQEIASLTRRDPTAHVLIADYEDHEQEWRGRIEDCRGDLSRVTLVAPFSPRWKAVREKGKSMGTVLEQADHLGQLAASVGATWLVIDSAMMAVPGLDVGDPVAPQKWSAALQIIGLPSLTLAHVTKAEEDPRYPFGSVFWHNLSRITWSLSREGDRLQLRSQKHNNYPDLGLYYLDEAPQVSLHGKAVASGFYNFTSVTMDRVDRIAAVLAEQGPLTVAQVTAALLDDGDRSATAPKVRTILSRYSERFSGDGGYNQKWKVEPES